MLRRDVAHENRLIAKRRDEERVSDFNQCRVNSAPSCLIRRGDSWLSECVRGYARLCRHDAGRVARAADQSIGRRQRSRLCLGDQQFSPLAFALMSRWGFAHKSMLTWIKPRFGLGSFFRNPTEHVLFGVRGHLPTKAAAASIGTHFEAPTGAHSEKPERFYEIVREAPIRRSARPFSARRGRISSISIANWSQHRDAPFPCDATAETQEARRPMAEEISPRLPIGLFRAKADLSCDRAGYPLALHGQPLAQRNAWLARDGAPHRQRSCAV